MQARGHLELPLLPLDLTRCQVAVIFTGSGWNGLLLDCVRPVLLDSTAGYGKCQ
jgi:hypothetical protein